MGKHLEFLRFLMPAVIACHDNSVGIIVVLKAASRSMIAGMDARKHKYALICEVVLPNDVAYRIDPKNTFNRNKNRFKTFRRSGWGP